MKYFMKYLSIFQVFFIYFKLLNNSVITAQVFFCFYRHWNISKNKTSWNISNEIFQAHISSRMSSWGLSIILNTWLNMVLMITDRLIERSSDTWINTASSWYRSLCVMTSPSLRLLTLLMQVATSTVAGVTWSPDGVPHQTHYRHQHLENPHPNYCTPCSPYFWVPCSWSVSYTHLTLPTKRIV